MRNVCLLIPALNPEDKLVTLIKEMKELGWDDPILLVDDGSSDEIKNSVFKEAEELGAIVVHHSINLGKGRALKTGFNEALVRFPNIIGVVTADADGQHLPKDIIKCADILSEKPEKLILGCRDFNKANVPAKSQIGNKFTRFSMGFLCGIKVTDTQTGLRGISRAYMKELLKVPGEKFDYETNMLLDTKVYGVDIEQYEIETVYFEQNRKSNYNPLKDSIKIFVVFFKFCMASLMGCLVDIVLFTIFNIIFKRMGMDKIYSIPIATALARVLSACTNYLLNKTMVFSNKNPKSHSALRYAILCVVQLACSAGLVTLLSTRIGGMETAWKIIVDILLFFASFQIQRRFVF
ncbi:MAG: bifunctional glycosyltransferase family 2/GtrA family protein [Lachnospiraceae bacterium]|nr:bifunctional glycosyltransferase family 2/GtrA family protein [Lachnospiraceae bacterium]